MTTEELAAAVHTLVDIMLVHGVELGLENKEYSRLQDIYYDTQDYATEEE